MTERLEPTISSQEPIEGREHASAKGAKLGSQTKRTQAAAAKANRPAPVSQRVVEVKSPLAPLALLAALVALGLVALLFWQVFTLDKEREVLLSSLDTADKRIAHLEQQLAVTGDASAQSLTALAANTKTVSDQTTENTSEIRKLWAVANERNKKAIAENTKAGARHKAATAKVQSGLESLKTDQQKALSALQVKLDELTGEIAVLSEVQESQQAAFNQDRSAAAEVKALKKDLNSRIKTNEEAIKSMDVFRLQTNRRLLELGGSAQ